MRSLPQIALRTGPGFMQDKTGESCVGDGSSLENEMSPLFGMPERLSKTPTYSLMQRSYSARSRSAFQNNPLIEASYIVAICESRGISTEIGVAAIDTRTSECIISQFSDCSLHINTSYFLNLYIPKKILVCASSNNENVGILQLLKAMFKTDDICILPRRCFNESMCCNILNTYSIEPCNEICNDTSSKYYCLSSLFALIRYLEEQEKISFHKNSLKITFKTMEDCMFIDSQTAAALELVTNLRDKKSKKHLLGVMNYTSTAMGYRMLRLQLLQPPLDIGTIRLRQEFIEELLQSESTFYQIRNELKTLVDVEVLISKLIRVPTRQFLKSTDFKIANILELKHMIEKCEILQNLLSTFTTELAQTLCMSLKQPDYAIMKAKIDEIISLDCTFNRNQNLMYMSKINAVKTGIDELLDMSRENFNFLVCEIDNCVIKYSINYGLTLKCLHNQKSGYFMSMRIQDSEGDLPKIFVNVTKSKGSIFFTTLELIKLNERLKECSDEIYIRSDCILSRLLDDIKTNLKSLYVMSGAILLLDFLVSLAFYRISNKEMTKPQFSDTLAVKHSRHPILDSLVSSFVPNNIFCYDGCNFQILTAPNMGGKTTYLKQVALIVIMSFVGSWVPASFASVRVTDKILSRFRNSDDISSNSSTFMTEMKDMAFILNNFTCKSLVLIDELGRGTSKTDGIGITLAICEKLIKENCFTYFATHFLDLTDFLQIYPNVYQMTFGFSLRNSELCFNYTMQKGTCSVENYGIKLATKSGFDETITSKAYEIANEIKEQRNYQKHLSSGSTETIERNRTISFAIKIQHILKNSTLPQNQLVPLLRQKVDEFTAEH